MKCYLIYWHLRSLGFIKPYKSPVGKIKERMKWQIQAAKMTFRSSMSGFSLKQRVRRMGTWPIYIEKSQMRWLRHLARMPPECLPGEVFREHPAKKRPWGRPKPPERPCLGPSRKKLDKVAREMELLASVMASAPATYLQMSGRT